MPQNLGLDSLRKILLKSLTMKKTILRSTLFVLGMALFFGVGFASCVGKKSVADEPATLVAEPIATDAQKDPAEDEKSAKEEKSKSEEAKPTETAKSSDESIQRVSIARLNLEKINPFGYAAENDGNYGPENPMGGLYQFPYFYSIGWSRDGKVAFGTCVTEEGRGGETAQFFVQDLITDKILWDYTYSDEFAPEPGDFFTGVVKSKVADFDAILERYNIQFPDVKMQSLPVSCNGEKIEFSVVKKVKNSEDDFIPEMDYMIKETKNGVTKTVVDKKSSPAFDVFPCGYMMSPYEDRVMLVYAEQQLTFEGTCLVYFVSGCDVNKGFKK